jgi:predicted Zn-dependent protease
LEFLFSYLLARQVRGVEVAADRPALADEVAPDISTASQRDRLRKQLYDLQTADPVFDQLLRSNRSHVSLDLDGVDLDVGRLLETSRSIRHRDFLIDTELAEQVRRQLDESRGEFLAGFSELEHQVTRGKGTAGQVVEEARAQVAGARADLALSLAQHDVAVGRPSRAIPYLKDALSRCPERQDLARVLVAAYLQTGQTAAATQLRREYEIEES